MNFNWTENTTYNPLPAPVVYVCQRLVGNAWVDVWETPNYLSGVAWCALQRKKNPAGSKVKLTINPKKLYV